MKTATKARGSLDGATSSSRRLTVVTLFGFASGLPFALTDSTLQAWLAVSGVDVKTIGLFSLLGLPYVLKFLWAPLLDRFCSIWLGRRRGWMAASQGAIVLAILSLGGRNPSDETLLVASIALALAFASATQDIAIDAYRAEILTADERGFGVGLSVAGYKVATIISGAGAFILADRLGFNAVYSIMALVAVLGLLVTVAAREPVLDVAEPQNLYTALVEPFSVFARRPDALALIALILLYKLGDAAVGRLSITFLVRALEFTLTEIGAVYKGVGITASVVGGVVGGFVMIRWGLFRSLLTFALAQAVTNLGFVLLALVGKSTAVMICVVVFENLFGGMGTAALVALLIALCDKRYTATQFALLSAIASLGRVLSGPFAGNFVAATGWTTFFIASLVIAIPGIILIVRLRRTIESVDQSR